MDQNWKLSHATQDPDPLFIFALSSFLVTTMANEIKYWHVTYNDIHNLIREVTPKIAAEFNPDLLIAIGSWSCKEAVFKNLSLFSRWRVSHLTHLSSHQSTISRLEGSSQPASW